MIFVVMILAGCVTLCLLMVSSQSEPDHPWRMILAAVLGGVYTGACLVPALSCFGGYIWRLICLLTIGILAYGTGKEGLRQSLLFLFLQLTLSGLLSAQKGKLFFIFAGVGCVLLLALRGRKQTVPVELAYGERSLRITALKDTGNGLKDPITGQPVLVIDADATEKLLGLTNDQLRDPVSTLREGNIPGLRLIPYQTISSSGGMLLALSVENARIGNRRGSAIVAFAPENFGRGSNIQALSGGKGWS